jgi:hypothetical protein
MVFISLTPFPLNDENKTSINLKNAVFLDGTLCGSCKNRRSEGTCLHHHGENNQRGRNKFSFN